MNYHKPFKKLQNFSRLGFTIVELLVVIVVIGILATVTLVSYNGISQKAVATVLQSDLKNASTKLELYKAENGSYPVNQASAESSGVLPSSSGTDYQYTVVGNDYYLSATSSSGATQAYYISSETGTIVLGVWSGHTLPGGAFAWQQIETGNQQTCALANDGIVYCWGSGANGFGPSSLTPVSINMSGVLSGKTIQSLSMKDYFACVIASDNQAYCWGDGESGQLGNGGSGGSLSPVAVDTTGVLSGKTILSISTGSTHACAIASDNQAYCWGNGSFGQHGDNDYDSSLVPVAVDTTGVLSGKTILSISSGYKHTCAIASDNQAYCWGGEDYGALGIGGVGESLVPIAVETSGVLSGKTILSISTSVGHHTCAIASDNQAYCWGYNDGGQLGNGSSATEVYPVAVDTSGALSGKTVSTIVAGGYHTCAIASDSKAYCWGNNDYYEDGVLGDGTTDNASLPVAVDTSGVLSGKNIVDISGSEYHTCAVDSEGVAYCWGGFVNGSMLGDGSGNGSLVPVLVAEP